MSGLFFILIFSVFCLFSSYQCLKHNRPYWTAPTIIGFKTRKRIENQGITKIAGFVPLISGLAGFLFVKVCELSWTMLLNTLDCNPYTSNIFKLWEDPKKL